MASTNSLFEQLVSILEKASTLENILIGTGTSLLLIGLQRTLSTITGTIGFYASSLSKGFSIDGYWSVFVKDLKGQIKYVELIRIKGRLSDISLTIWHYGPNYKQKSGYKYYGKGISKGNNICAYYYLASRSYPETGCFVLHLVGNCLVGPYIQFAAGNNGETLLKSDEDMKLKRLNIPWLLQLQMAFGRMPFKDYTTADAYLKQDALYID